MAHPCASSLSARPILPVLPALASLVLLALPVAGAVAQGTGDFPNRPVRLVTGSPGSTADISARLVGQKLVERWGQQIVVDNRGGAGGIVGAEIAVPRLCAWLCQMAAPRSLAWYVEMAAPRLCAWMVRMRRTVVARLAWQQRLRRGRSPGRSNRDGWAAATRLAFAGWL